MASPFPHRRNKDGSYDSICPKCLVTITNARTERELLASEQKHVCERDLMDLSENSYLNHQGEGSNNSRIQSARPQPLSVPKLSEEAIICAKELRGFLNKLGPRPTVNHEDYKGQPDSTDLIVKATDEEQVEWGLKLRQGYSGQYALRLKSLIDRFGENGIGDTYINTYIDSIAFEGNVDKVADGITAMAVELAKKEWSS
jgi:hypothetical protein